MALTATKPGGWAFNEDLSSAQISAIDANVASAVDKRSGQSDTISSAITLAYPGTFVIATGAIETVASGGQFIMAGTETISSGGNLNVASGGALTVQNGGVSTVNAGGTLTASGGSHVTLAGTTNITGGTITGGTIGGANISGGAISVPAATVTTLTAPTANVGSLDVSGDCHIHGSLTVDGGNNIPGPPGISFDNVAITNSSFGGSGAQSITGGTMTSTALTGVTIDGTSTISMVGGSVTDATITGGSVGAANGIATLNSSGLLSEAQRGGWYVVSTYGRLATNFSATSFSYVDITGMQNSHTCVAGDHLIIDAKFTVDATHFAGIRMMVNDGGGDIDPSEMLLTNPGVVTSAMNLSFRYVVVNSGTVTVRAQVYNAGGGTPTIYGDSGASGSSSLRVLQYRP